MRQLHLEAQFKNPVYVEYTAEKNNFHLRGLNDLSALFKTF